MEVDSIAKCEDCHLLSLKLEEKDKQVKYSWKIIKTVTISISEVILVIITNLILTDIHLDMTYTELSIASSMASVGAIFGAILGGVLTKKMGNYLDLIMVVVHLVNAAALLGVPFSNNMIAQSIELWFQGMAMTVGFVVNNVMVVRIWPDKVGSTVLLLAAFGSLGNIFGPLLAVPFVSHEYSADSFSPLVFWPFVILAILFVANAINLSIQYAIGLGCHQCHDSEASMAEKKEDRKEPKRQSQLLWLVVPGMGLVDFFVRASDTIPAYLLPSIGIESRLNMVASQSNLVLALYDVSRTISKLLASLLMKRVSVLICVPICLVMTSVLALFLYLWGLTSVPAYFMIVIIMGMFTGPTATLLVVWCNEYITVDGYAMSVWQVAENVAILSSVLVGGIVFGVYGSLLVLLVNFIAGLIGCIAFLILQFAISTSCRLTQSQHYSLK
ncbi:hypothetical protein CAPTEDRAFT_212130 [Capitella teleta]|uniref:Major facilitator superfamily (MFS) profile domain-containing protein n=1 Tax=Capitella teleta TaxID=283909 RepID=R7T701_CAPTE|nr:hypothetical protein CAPTEDRAFT_212130 [Capitella teleta]|eukprot:ELT87130.1 hypothetical protein CAPTEDRAFT_212130 [Capitella teleta]